MRGFRRDGREPGDFVVFRADGVPAYQLAVVVDDASDGVTEVLRGEDLLPSAARQALVMAALGLARPEWVHVPLVLDETGKMVNARFGPYKIYRADEMPQIEADLARKMVFVAGPRQVDKPPLARSLLDAKTGYLNWDVPQHREQILRGEREMLEGESFSYDPAGRRDPFRSLREGFERNFDEESEPRPPGLPGMTVDEIRLEGIIETPNGILAFVQGRDSISYILRPGTKLYDGEVKDIQFDRVVFRKQSNDPKQLKPYEDVVREITD